MATANLSTFLRRLTRGMAAESLGNQSDRQLVARLLQRELGLPWPGRRDVRETWASFTTW